ncbi:MAG: hypothetical protein AB8W37_04430 [Arsenophonus endosymbiont of Dermacentor nuttalli]
MAGAIKSLKFVNIQRRAIFEAKLVISDKQTFSKAGKIKEEYESVTAQYSDLLEDEPWVFKCLHEQIIE